MRLEDISENDIMELADSSAIAARGLDYYETGQIKSFRVENNRIIAKVAGSYGLYDTEVFIEDGELDVSCNCPYEGYCCKHAVAVMYKWMNDRTGIKIPKNYGKTEVDVKSELMQLNKEELIELIMNFSDKDMDVKRDLTVMLSKDDEAEKSQVKEIINGQIREALSKRGGFIDYHTLPTVVRRLEEIKDSAISYAPNMKAYTLERLTNGAISALEAADDSDGRLGSFIDECLIELGKAIKAQRLSLEEKQKVIVENLDRYENDKYGLTGHIDLVIEIPETEAEFDFLIGEIKKRIADPKNEHNYRGVLTEIYKRGKRDDEYLKDIETSLEKTRRYLPVVEFWKSKGDIGKAVKYAEEGIKYTDNMANNPEQLYEFLEQTYSQQKKNDDLMRIKLLHFDYWPSLVKYKEIKELCKNSKAWGEIKTELLKKAKHQTRIEIRLHEKELDEAYEELIKSWENCRDTFKAKVANELLEEYPKRAVKIYTALVEEFCSMGGRDNYRIAAQYGKKLKEIMIGKMDQRASWERFVMSIRNKNRRRPALIEEFRRL